MNEIFGLSMSAIMVALLALLSLCLLMVAWVAWRRPVIFKLGVRNIPRRRAQTTLIVVGLMLSTLIISAALGTGDTLDYSTTSEVYRSTGHVDEFVVSSQDTEGDIGEALDDTIDASALALVESTLAGNPNVDGIMPILDERVPVVNETKQQGEPVAILTGIDPSRIDQFGGLQAKDGRTIDLGALAPNEIVISEEAADKLDAEIGDTLTTYYANQPITLTVAAIAEDGLLAGERDTKVSLVMPLDRLQQLTNQPNTLSSIAISNTGGVRDSEAATDAVVATLAPALAGKQLGIDPIKQDSLDFATDISTIFTTIFLVLGLFSIAAGILLIVLIFTMLAAERRPEMGMARAVGTQRRQLIQQYIAEGSGYAILAGVVGSALGVLVTFGIGFALRALFGDFLPIEPHVTVRSMIAAFSLGVVITFVAVVGSSWKISRLNIVAAVRDIPDVNSPTRKKSGLVWGLLLVGVGAVMTLIGLNSDTAFPFYFGMSLVPFGLTLILRFFGIRNRAILTAVGTYILVLWLLPMNISERLWGELDGDIEMFFLSGIFMVIGATIVIIQNTDLLLAGVSRLGGLFKSKLPAVRTAVAYPGAARGRTGLTIAMFSLIIFSLVMMATMNQNFVNLFLGDEAAAGWDVRADAISANPITDFTGTLEADGVNTSDFSAVGVVTSPSRFSSDVRLANTTDWTQTTIHGMDDGFIDNSQFIFSQRAVGYDSDDAIVEALRTEPNVAVVDASAIPSSDGGFGPESDDPFKLTGLTSDDKTFEPYTAELATPDGGTATVKIIGVIDTKVSSLVGIYSNQTTISAAFPTPAATSYYVSLTDPDNSDAVAKRIEAALLHNGVQGISIQDELKENQQQATGFLYLIEGFMGLGLFVGVAAVGVIAFRSVVERRQQIGVLRAIGYQQGMVSLSFMIETAFIVGMGVLSGTALGIILARNLFTSDDGAGSASGFMVPWPLISSILIATVAVALLMTWIPSRQAARIAPAEALRYE